MKVTMWGTRGSLPILSPDNMRFGGNTACVEVRSDGGDLIVLDAGTGIRRLGETIGSDVRRVDILLTHLHMDHLQGLGFFAPLYEPDLDVHVWGPAHSPEALRTELNMYLSPPLFAVRLRDLPCHLTLHQIPRGRFRIGAVEIVADFVLHPGPTMGFRVEEHDAVVTYLPDHEPALGAHEFPGDPEWTSGYDLAESADLLIHDAQYSPSEYREHVGWGHSSIFQAFHFARLARVRRLVTFHHDPGHDDDEIDRLTQSTLDLFTPRFEVVAGAEGASFQVIGRGGRDA